MRSFKFLLLIIPVFFLFQVDGFGQIGFGDSTLFTQKYRNGTFYKESISDLNYWKNINSVWELYPPSFDHSNLIITKWEVLISVQGKAAIWIGKNENISAFTKKIQNAKRLDFIMKVSMINTTLSDTVKLMEEFFLKELK